jgi:hypothetical protein
VFSIGVLRAADCRYHVMVPDGGGQRPIN